MRDRDKEDDYFDEQDRESGTHSPPRDNRSSSSGSDDDSHEEDSHEQLDEPKTEDAEENSQGKQTEKDPNRDQIPVDPIITTVELDEEHWGTINHSVEDPESPRPGSQSTMEITTVDPSSIEFERAPPTSVSYPVRPLAEDKTSLTIPVVDDVQMERRSDTVQTPATKDNEDVYLSTEQSASLSGVFEMDQDPVYDWIGGTPYGDRHPRFVIHVDDERGQSLEYLKRVLRDYHSTVREGEPSAETVEFVANKPKIPSINNRIVTLDVDGEEWAVDVADDSCKITRNDRDLVPDLKRVASNLFTGNLGYFVLNLSPDLFNPLTKPADQFLSQLQTELERTHDQGPPDTVLIADRDREIDWWEVGRRYFGLSEAVAEDLDTISEIEERFYRHLHRQPWASVSLTSLQSESLDSDGESDDHYLYKASIVASLTYRLFESVDADDYPEFVNRLIEDDETIVTEQAPDEPPEERTQPDLLIGSGGDFEAVPLVEAIDDSLGKVEQVAIEFETGRQQGAFKFRKIRSTLERYRQESISVDFVAVVVPCSLLHMGEEQARLLLKMVEEWSELESDVTHGAGLFVPNIAHEEGVPRDRQIRIELTPAQEFLEELYPDNDE